MNELTDEQLITQSLGGEPEAFGHLVSRHQERLYRSLCHALGSRDDAFDVSQEAFLLAYKGLATYRGQSAFYSWLYRIALNVAASARRKAKLPVVSVDAQAHRDGRRVDPLDPHPDGRPDYAMEVAEHQRLVQLALSELSEEFRSALVLKEMDGLRYEEIAEVLGCPVGTVRSRIHRARQELRAKLSVLLYAEAPH